MPSRSYYMFHLARKTGKLVVDLLSGGSHQISGMEYYLWQRFEQVTQRIEYQERQKRK